MRSNMMRINVVFSLLCLLCGITSSCAFVFEDCGSEIGKFSEMSISSCDVSDEKCSLPRGIDIIASLKFTTNKAISIAEVQVFGVLLDVPIPFPLKESNVCKNLSSGLKCPLKKDQEVDMKTTVYLEKQIPVISADVIYELKNEEGEKIVCIKFPVKVV